MTTLPKEEARAFLVGHHRLKSFQYQGVKALPKLLRDLRCIQLDPLDVIGTNADLVALARVKGIRRGDLYGGLYPGHAFEHFFKERCLLPAESFPWYREKASETLWWRLTERLKRLPEGVVEKVLEEIREHGPVFGTKMTVHGKVKPMDWSGWKGTTNATRMAIEVLWTRCEIVVCGRAKNSKCYDVPERALPHFSFASKGNYLEWAVRERTEAAGLLTLSAGPIWSVIAEARTSSIIEALVERGELELVVIEGAPRKYLAPKGFRDRKFPRFDGRLRILGPLDPLIWDRLLVKQVFGFDYVWEVYKPEKLRKYGWYVCPLILDGVFVGRIEAAIEKDSLVVKNVWWEKGKRQPDALNEALERHAEACGVGGRVRYNKRR